MRVPKNNPGGIAWRASPKTERLVDKAYRKSAQGRVCMVEGCHDCETVVLAHIATAGNSGMGIKPPDSDSVFLCAEHHSAMDLFPGQRAEWILANLYLPARRMSYRAWDNAQQFAKGRS